MTEEEMLTGVSMDALPPKTVDQMRDKNAKIPVSVKGEGSYNILLTELLAEAEAHSSSNLDAHIQAINPHGLTPTDIGLGNVENTRDADKPVSNATAQALEQREPVLPPATDADVLFGDRIWRNFGQRVLEVVNPYSDYRAFPMATGAWSSLLLCTVEEPPNQSVVEFDLLIETSDTSSVFSGRVRLFFSDASTTGFDSWEPLSPYVPVWFTQTTSSKLVINRRKIGSVHYIYLAHQGEYAFPNARVKLANVRASDGFEISISTEDPTEAELGTYYKTVWMNGRVAPHSSRHGYGGSDPLSLDTRQISNMSAFGRTLVDDATAAEARSTLEAAPANATLSDSVGSSSLPTAGTATALTTLIQQIRNYIRWLNENKQGNIPNGTTSQYYRGDKSWQDLAAAVRSAVLSGLSVATNASISATDSVLGALGKLQAQISSHSSRHGYGADDQLSVDTRQITNMTAFMRTLVDDSNGAEARTTLGAAPASATLTDSAGNSSLPTASTATALTTLIQQIRNYIRWLNENKQGNIPNGTASQYYRGDKSWQDLATAVRSAVLSGLSVATNASISATDSVLGALGKLQAQISSHSSRHGYGADDQLSVDTRQITNMTAFMRTLVDDATAAEARATIEAAPANATLSDSAGSSSLPTASTATALTTLIQQLRNHQKYLDDHMSYRFNIYYPVQTIADHYCNMFSFPIATDNTFILTLEVAHCAGDFPNEGRPFHLHFESRNGSHYVTSTRYGSHAGTKLAVATGSGVYYIALMAPGWYCRVAGRVLFSHGITMITPSWFTNLYGWKTYDV